MIHAALAALLAASAFAHEANPEAEAQAFLALYAPLLQGVYKVSSDASWLASTDVKPAHDAGRVIGNKALAAVTGNPRVIETLRRLRAGKTLRRATRRQLDKMWLSAAENPGTLPDVVARRVEAESRQSSTLDGFQFCAERKDGACVKPVTANDIDEVLIGTRDLSVRLRYWEASKETGPALKAGLSELQALRNQVARHFAFKSFHALQVADYGMTVDEMSRLMEGFQRDIAPLYAGLHCWAKHELAKRYGQPVPERLIPAHWLGNRWGQNWTGLVEAVDLSPYFKDRSAEWIVKQAEEFYVSMGFPKLPESFWKGSDLYPVPADGPRKKNTHASAWHVDLGHEVRSLMSVEPVPYWFGTAHHELGHIYYFLAYSRPDNPVLLRDGANRAFHEGIGELITIASLQVPYLRQAGILPADRDIDRVKWLLSEAAEETVAFLPWSAGVMHSWERDLYELDLSSSQWNQRWWDYVERFQGIAPPAPRGEELCDACTKTHVNDDPAQYYDYAMATVLKYQLHDHICRDILKQEPYSCNYFGSRKAGDFLRKLLAPGSSRDWRELLRELTGSELSTKPMMEYFKPLNAFLEKENAGRSCAWRPGL